MSKLLKRERFAYDARLADGTIMQDVRVDEALQGGRYPADAWATRQAADRACPAAGPGPWIEYATDRTLPD